MTAGPVFAPNGRQTIRAELPPTVDNPDAYKGRRTTDPPRGAERPCCRCGRAFQPTAKRWRLCGPCFSHAETGEPVYMDGAGL